MASPADKDRRYILRGGSAGRERLRVLSGPMRSVSGPLLDRAGVHTGARCIDVGCGGGDVTVELASRAGPAGRVVGIDLDDAKLTLARDEAAAAGRMIDYRRADVTTDDLGRDFDFVYARFLLTHLREPEAVCARFLGALRPGGTVIIEDIDYGGCVCHPDRAAYRRYCEIYTATARTRGFDPYIGLRVPEILLAAGFEDVRVSAAQPLGRLPEGEEGAVKLACAMTIENIGEAAISEGVAEREEVDRVTDELYRLAADSTTLMSYPRIVQCWARRPG